MYRTHSRSSFNRIQEFHEQISSVKSGNQRPVIIVGNASNEHGKDFDGAKYVVSQEEVQFLTTNFACGFMEVSVRIRVDVENVVSDLVRG
jgi:hypothetical protein